MWAVYVLVGLFIIGLILYYLDNVKYVYYERRLKASEHPKIINKEDIEHLPKQVKRYLTLVGVIGKAYPKGMHLKITGEMKANKEMPFAKASVKQTSSFDPYSRYFYIELKMKGVKVKGLHLYHHARALMKIKVLGLFRVVNGKGPKMNQAETVTVFNDMCLLAPHALVNANVTYKEINDNTLEATFTNEGITVSAVLTFDDAGKLINFVSDDRYFSEDGTKNVIVPWSTPIYEYKEQNGFYLPYKGDAVWLFDEEDYVYFKLRLDDVKYIT